MSEIELLHDRGRTFTFNPLIAKAFTQFESENDARTTTVMREIVVAGLKTGAAPEKVYATIKTGRMLTKDNMQFLTPAEIQEWADAVEEYRMLAACR